MRVSPTRFHWMLSPPTPSKLMSIAIAPLITLRSLVSTVALNTVPNYIELWAVWISRHPCYLTYFFLNISSYIQRSKNWCKLQLEFNLKMFLASSAGVCTVSAANGQTLHDRYCGEYLGYMAADANTNSPVCGKILPADFQF